MLNHNLSQKRKMIKKNGKFNHLINTSTKSIIKMFASNIGLQINADLPGGYTYSGTYCRKYSISVFVVLLQDDFYLYAS